MTLQGYGWNIMTDIVWQTLELFKQLINLVKHAVVNPAECCCVLMMGLLTEL